MNPAQGMADARQNSPEETEMSPHRFPSGQLFRVASQLLTVFGLDSQPGVRRYAELSLEEKRGLAIQRRLSGDDFLDEFDGQTATLGEIEGRQLVRLQMYLEHQAGRGGIVRIERFGWHGHYLPW